MLEAGALLGPLTIFPGKQRLFDGENVRVVNSHLTKRFGQIKKIVPIGTAGTFSHGDPSGDFACIKRTEPGFVALGRDINQRLALDASLPAAPSLLIISRPLILKGEGRHKAAVAVFLTNIETFKHLPLDQVGHPVTDRARLGDKRCHPSRPFGRSPVIVRALPEAASIAPDAGRSACTPGKSRLVDQRSVAKQPETLILGRRTLISLDVTPPFVSGRLGSPMERAAQPIRP